MDSLSSFLHIKFLGIEVWVYFASLGAILAGFIAKKIVAVLFVHMAKVATKTRVIFDDIFIAAINKPTEWLALLAGIFIALKILPFPSEPIDINKFIAAAMATAGIWLVIWVAVRLVDGISDWWGEVAKKTESKFDDQLVPILRKSLKSFLYIIGVVLVMQNLGYSVGSLLAGLGIGGAALALASKDAVANFFGSIVIFLDKPFQVGDWIEMGEVEGTVEEVGIRTTRVRTFANSLVTLPNSLFTTTAINNWSRMQKRRIKMTIGVTYSTPPEQLEELVGRIRRIIDEDANLHSDFYLVNFDNFGSSSLDIFIYCFTVTTNWATFLNAKQDFMLKVMHTVQEMGLSFAFPTQSIHVETLPGEPAALSSQRPS